MTIDKVIELGEKAEFTTDFDWFSAPWWVWLLISVSSFCLGIAIREVIVYGEIEGFGAVIALLGATFLFYMLTIDKETHDGVDAWKKNVAVPYIESLPVEKKEVIFIKIDPELSHNTTGASLFGSGYTYSKEVEKTPLVVSFKDDGVVTRTDWYQTNMELTEDEKPYIEYQKLHKNLGHGINAGMYNVKVYLPESYEFTDIK